MRVVSTVPASLRWVVAGPTAIPTILFILCLGACSGFQPWVHEGVTPRPPDFPGQGEAAQGELSGKKVTVRYDVSCTVCEIQFTDSRGNQRDFGRANGSWRHQEFIPASHHTVTLVVTPGSEYARVNSARIRVEGFQVTQADIPTGGVRETVVISAPLPVGWSGP